MNESRKIFLVELETIEPVTIASNKGKSKFIESLRYIPASSILGAISRKVLLENIFIFNNMGNCSQITNPNVLPNCDVCSTERCKYRMLWKERDLKLTNGVVGGWDINAPGVVNLQSLGELREKGKEKEKGEEDKKKEKRDLLLYLFVEQEKRAGRLQPRILLDLTSSLNYKKKPGNVIGLNIVDEDEVKMIQFGRVSIGYRFKTSKEGELYGFTAIKEGQKFRFMIVAQEELEDCFNCEIKIGAWKSRGMGLVKIEVAESREVESYIDERSEHITKGFDEIGKILEEYGVDGYYGTYTFLTDGTTEDCGVQKQYRIHRIRRLRRYEKRSDGSYFILRDVISAGSVGVFSVNEPESVSHKLAEIEIRFVEEPWFDWVFFNHPIHYERSSLKEVV